MGWGRGGSTPCDVHVLRHHIQIICMYSYPLSSSSNCHGPVWSARLQYCTVTLCCLCLLPQSYVFTYFRGRFLMIAGDFDQVGFTMRNFNHKREVMS